MNSKLIKEKLKLAYITIPCSPSSLTVRTSSVGNSHSKGADVISHHTVGHVLPITVLLTHLPRVGTDPRSLSTKKSRLTLDKQMCH